MSAKDDILNALREHQPPDVTLPDLKGNWITYDNVQDHFCSVVNAVGGQVVKVSSQQQLEAEVNRVIQELQAEQVFSELPGMTVANININDFNDPHECEKIDFALIMGEFGVAENGAIWVADHSIKYRVTWFITQHIGIVLSAESLLHNLHEAYEKLNFTEPEFGVFISGPSKTADIEQSLVIGAHGPRSLTVFLMENS